MGGTVMSGPSSQAEQTTAFLQQAAQRRLPVMIPGALERRVGRPAASRNDATEMPVTPRAPSAAVSDRNRLEREREGGGAPSQRGGGGRHATFLANIWRSMLHPSQVGVIWRNSPALPR